MLAGSCTAGAGAGNHTHKHTFSATWQHLQAQCSTNKALQEQRTLSTIRRFCTPENLASHQCSTAEKQAAQEPLAAVADDELSGGRGGQQGRDRKEVTGSCFTALHIPNASLLVSGRRLSRKEMCSPSGVFILNFPQSPATSLRRVP
eukprot:scaffold212058_cov22-Tisochrysis_lutea.AAC.1